MRPTARTIASPQRGMALLTSMLLLMIITLMAIAMFRSVGTQEKVAGNLREKDRALHSAEAAQQYGEWWLLQGSNIAIGSVNCAAGVMNANLGPTVGEICAIGQTAQVMFGDMTLPANWNVRTTYLPQGMSVTAGVPGANGDIAYAQVPAFYIADLGIAADGAGEAYQVAAYGFGGATGSIAVVESVYEVQQGVVNRGGL
jgi:type IV pilus assembly protein PilX